MENKQVHQLMMDPALDRLVMLQRSTGDVLAVIRLLKN